MQTSNTLFIQWRKEKRFFYLGEKKVTWSKVGKKVKNKRKGKKQNYQPDTRPSKPTTRYPIHDGESDRQMGYVTYAEVESLKKLGFKILAEKDGFQC